MANKRLVWSGGNNTGGSISGAPVAGDWTNAYTTLQGALTARLASEEVWVHAGATSTHSQTYTANTSFTCPTASPSDPCLIKGVDKDNSNVELTTPSTTVNFQTSSGNFDISFNFAAVFRGIHISSTRSILTANLADATFFASNCKFIHTTTAATSASGFISLNSNTAGGIAVYDNCEFNCPQSNNGTVIIKDGFHFFNSCVFTGNLNSSIGLFNLSPNQSTSVEIRGGNLSGLPASSPIVGLPSSSNDNGRVKFIYSKLPTSFVVTPSTWAVGSRITLQNSDTGNTLYRTELHSYWGDVKTDSSSYLTASDPDKTGSTTGQRISFKMTPRGAQCLRHSAMEGVPIPAYIGSTGSKIFNLQAVENYTTALKDSEAWIDIYYLDDSGSPLWKLATTKVIDDHLEAALPAGSGTGAWTTPPTGSRSVKFEKTIAVNHVGYYQIVPYIGKFESGKVMHYNSQVTVT